MNLLILSDLHLALRDLLGKRKKVLLSCGSGKLYEPMLRRKFGEIDKLPASLRGGVPLSQELDETDVSHDGFGGALWFLTEAYLRLPSATPAVRAACQRIRDAFIRQLGELQHPYATEAGRAASHRTALAPRKADLKLLSVVDGTALDWATAFVVQGEKLDELLSQRGDAVVAASKSSRRPAGTLRGATLGILSRLRSAIADEVAEDDSLPRDLDAQIFGYVDQLARAREAQNAAAAARSASAATPADAVAALGGESDGEPAVAPAPAKPAASKKRRTAAKTPTKRTTATARKRTTRKR